MALTIKTPSSNIAGKGSTKPSGGGIFDGEPGYQKRTPGHGGPPEKTYDREKPSGSPSLKTPSGPATITKKS